MTDLWLPRDVGLERELTRVAALSAGLPAVVAEGLSGFADARAHPGDVRQRDLDRETAEEYADARNYLVWGIQPIYARVLAGESCASADYERRMRSLARVAEAWFELHRPSA